MTFLTAYPHIIELDGRFYVEGTKVPVQRLWSWHKRGTSFEALLKRYPALTPAMILSALAFGYDNQIAMGEEEAKLAAR